MRDWKAEARLQAFSLRVVGLNRAGSRGWSGEAACAGLDLDWGLHFLALRFCMTRGYMVTGKSKQCLHFCEGSGEEGEKSGQKGQGPGRRREVRV